jgi:hypothetical protein
MAAHSASCRCNWASGAKGLSGERPSQCDCALRARIKFMDLNTGIALRTTGLVVLVFFDVHTLPSNDDFYVIAERGK